VTLAVSVLRKALGVALVLIGAIALGLWLAGW
jgi:hypothetical protein